MNGGEKMAVTKKTTANETVSKKSVSSFSVANEYQNHSSLLANCVEIPIEDGKVMVSAELANVLKKKGYLK